VKLGELEERAEELDKKRTATISSVSLINDRNRKANVSKAEVAIMREIAHKKLHGQEVSWLCNFFSSDLRFKIFLF